MVHLHRKKERGERYELLFVTSRPGQMPNSSYRSFWMCQMVGETPAYRLSLHSPPPLVVVAKEILEYVESEHRGIGVYSHHGLARIQERCVHEAVGRPVLSGRRAWLVSSTWDSIVAGCSETLKDWIAERPGPRISDGWCRRWWLRKEEQGVRNLSRLGYLDDTVFADETLRFRRLSFEELNRNMH